MKKKIEERWLNRKRYVTDDWGSTEEITNRAWLKYNVIPAILMGLVMVGLCFIIIYACKYANDHKARYDAAVIVGIPSIVIHIDHYCECTDNRYMLYDKDGKVYNVDKQYVVFYNYDDKE